MTQKISFQYRDPEDTELLNRRWEGIIEPGVKQGFEVTLGTDPPQTTITIRRGVLVTSDFCRIEETEPIIDALPIPPNEAAHARWDLVVCEHRYLRSVPPPVAMYAIIQGEPSNTPTLPTLPPNCVPLAYCLLPAGGVRYTDILNFVTQFKYNCAWDDAASAWRIVFGAKMALLVSITPNAAPALSVTPGLRVFVHAGNLPDGSVITWTRVMELTPQGFTELVALAQEVIAARGTKSTLDARLDVSLGEDGTYKRTGFLDQVMDEVEAARGSMASIDARLDVSLNHDGTYRRVGILDDIMDEVDAARGSKASLDERLDVSLNNDGTIKTAALQEKIGHADLVGMPDSNGANGDHDVRYYRKSEIDSTRDRIHGDGVLSGVDYLGAVFVFNVGLCLQFSSGYILHNGKLVYFDGGYSDAINEDAVWYISMDADGTLVTNQSGFGSNVPIRKLRMDGGAIKANSDKRDVISLPDRRNTFRCASDKLPGAWTHGGFSLFWIGRLAIGSVDSCGVEEYQGQNRGYCVMGNADHAAPFSAGMPVVFFKTYDQNKHIFFRTVHAVISDKVYFTSATGFGDSSSGTLSEYRVIDDSADFRDRCLTGISALRYDVWEFDQYLPGDNYDDHTYHGICATETGGEGGIHKIGNLSMCVGQVYTRAGIPWTETGWDDQSCTSYSGPFLNILSILEYENQGWRLFAEAIDGRLILTCSKFAWGGVGGKGGFAQIYLNLMVSPDLGVYV